MVEAPLLVQTAAEHSSPASALVYRSLRPCDLLELKEAHAALFPIDYEHNFFHKATNGLDRIWSYAAFSSEPYDHGRLVGFITTKSVFLHEVDMSDRAHMGLLSPVVDHDKVVYILTLGVVEGYRHQGIASALIRHACQHACENRCRAVFLHVITYNTAAMALYSRQGFTCVARLAAFYHIATGRQPDPTQQVYDAYLYVQHVGGAAGVLSPWDMISMAWSPLRLAWGRMNSCIPAFCRQQQLQQQQQRRASGFQQADIDRHSRPGSNLYQPPGSGTAHNQVIDVQQHCQQEQWIRHQRQHQQQHSHPPLQTQQPHPVSRRHHKASSWAANTPPSQQKLNQPPPYRQQHQQGSQPLLALQQQQQPPQRMLRWLFNGATRNHQTPHQQQQQQQPCFSGHRGMQQLDALERGV